MSGNPKSADIDKQLQETFSVYIVEPMHDDIESQLTALQKKWFGESDQYDPDTPYLETLMDDRLQRINSKLDKQRVATEETTRTVISSLEEIVDSTGGIDALTDQSAAVYETVQELGKHITGLADGINRERTAIQTDMAADTEKLINAIAASKKQTDGSLRTVAEDLKQVLSASVEGLNQQARKESAMRKADMAEDTKKIFEAITATAQQSEETFAAVADDLKQTLAAATEDLSRRTEQEYAVQQERLDAMSTQVGTFVHQYDAERKTLRNMLYLSLGLNAATLLGLIVTLLVLLFSR